MKNILIMGCGELGSRHLQGLLLSHNPLSIVVYDTFEKSLSLAMARANEVDMDNHFNNKIINYTTNPECLRSEWDLAILATTAETRLEALKRLLDCSSVKSLILEKLLTQSVDDLIEMKSVLECNIEAWVNCPRRCMKIYKDIKQYIREKLGTTCLSIEVNIGYSELVTNAIHFLELHAWLNDTEIVDLRPERLGPWLESKRRNNYDTSGVLKATYKDNSCLRINCVDSPIETTLQLSISEGCILVNEITGIWHDLQSNENHGHLEFQSTMTGSIADLILDQATNFDSSLPKFQEIYEMHTLMLEVFGHHWNSSTSQSVRVIPIT